MSLDDASALDVLSAARRAAQFVEGLREEDFLQDYKTQSAVMPNCCSSARQRNDCHVIIASSTPRSIGRAS